MKFQIKYTNRTHLLPSVMASSVAVLNCASKLTFLNLQNLLYHISKTKTYVYRNETAEMSSDTEFLLSIICCVWDCIVGHRKNEAYFIVADGKLVCCE